MKSQSDRQPEQYQSFLQLFTPNNRAVFHFILSMVPNWNDAQDIMQETSRVLWEKFDQFEPGTEFLAWALTIARFQVLDYRRKRGRGGILLEEMGDVFLEHVPQQDTAADRISALRLCLTKLSSDDRKHIQMRFKEGLTPKLLARTLDQSLKQIYRHEARIMGLLHRCIRRRLFQEGVLG